MAISRLVAPFARAGARPRRTLLLLGLAALLALAFLLLVTVPASSAGLGGDDMFVASDSDIPNFDSYSMDIASNGDEYLAMCVNPAVGDATIRVFRSQDGGSTWKQFGTLVATSYDLLQPRLRVVEGSMNRVYVAYVAYDGTTSVGVRVSSAAMSAATATWTTTVALKATGVRMYHPDLQADAYDRTGYWLTVVAEADSSVGQTSSVVFAQSGTFGTSWDPALRVVEAHAAGDRHERPRIAYGHDRTMHVAWFFEPVGGADAGVLYQRLDSQSGVLLGGQVALAPTGDGNIDLFPAVAAQHNGNAVLVAWLRAEGNSKFRSSLDAGATWAPGDTARISGGWMCEPVALPTEGFRVGYGTDTFGVMGSSWATPVALSNLGLFSDRVYYDGLGTSNALVFDASRGDRLAMAWTVIHTGTVPDSLLFDAEWRADPGNPRLKPGFPAALASPPVTPLVIAGLEGTPMLDVVFADSGGSVRAYRHDGTPVPGWPQHAGTLPSQGAVAVADLDADGHDEVIVGLADGRVFAYRDDGSVQPGWPFDPGSGEPSYVSVANFYHLRGEQVVVLNGNTVYVLKSDATTAGGYFPYTVYPKTAQIFAHPAALGDLNNDGLTDIVAPLGPYLYMISGYMSFVYTGDWFADGDVISGQPSLADVDGDTQLEIAFPTNLGRVGLCRWTATMLPGWPVTAASHKTQTSVAFANVLGTSAPEMAWCGTYDSTVCLYYKDGTDAVGWPHGTTGNSSVFGSPIVEHLDGGPGSVLVGSRDGRGYAWKNLGGAVGGWPRDLGGKSEVSPASGDLDHDGLVDVVFATRTRLVAYTTAATLDRQYPTWQWPMAGYDAAGTACLGCFGPQPGATPGAPAPARLALSLPRPSPAQGEVRFSYTLPAPGHARLAVYDVTGRMVRPLLDGVRPAGSAEAAWDGRDAQGRPAASGVYYLRLEADPGWGPQSVTRKVLRLR